MPELSRRTCLALLAGPLLGARGAQVSQPALAAAQEPGPQDWSCPMDPDVRSEKPGVCPRCGMRLVLRIPDRVEFPMSVSHTPRLLKPGGTANLTLRVLNPATGTPVTHFEVVHEKLMHLFLVSQDLEFFAHVHPEPQPDGSFQLSAKLPKPGMYRMLADFYPAGSVPQLALNTLYVSGNGAGAKLTPALDPCRAANLTASLRLDPEQPLAGLETKLFFTLNPAAGLERYLGAWGHMLAASEDLIDLIHIHPFLADGGAVAQFNVLFPRPGLYRVWTQFQREGVVNTVVFNVPVRAL